MPELALPRAGTVPLQVPRPPIRGPVLGGLLTLLAFFLGFGSWAALAPLSSAAVAPGAVRVESNRKTVQHLEGGIIEELRVRDGDVVRADQVLIRLDRTQAEAHYQALRHRYDSLRSARLRNLRLQPASCATLHPAGGRNGRRLALARRTGA